MIMTKKKAVAGFEDVTMDHLFNVNGGAGSMGNYYEVMKAKASTKYQYYIDPEGNKPSPIIPTDSRCQVIFYKHWAFAEPVLDVDIEKFYAGYGFLPGTLSEAGTDYRKNH